MKRITTLAFCMAFVGGILVFAPAGQAQNDRDPQEHHRVSYNHHHKKHHHKNRHHKHQRHHNRHDDHRST